MEAFKGFTSTSQSKRWTWCLRTEVISDQRGLGEDARLRSVPRKKRPATMLERQPHLCPATVAVLSRGTWIFGESSIEEAGFEDGRSSSVKKSQGMLLVMSLSC